MRGVMALVVVLVGIVLAVVTYLLLVVSVATPAGPGYSNPWIVDGPTLFIISILLIAFSAVARELIVGHKSG